MKCREELGNLELQVHLAIESQDLILRAAERVLGDPTDPTLPLPLLLPLPLSLSSSSSPSSEVSMGIEGKMTNRLTIHKGYLPWRSF